MKLVVIKIGTGVLTRESDGLLDCSALTKLVITVADLVKSVQPCVQFLAVLWVLVFLSSS